MKQFTYDGNDKETYYIFDNGKLFAEILINEGEAKEVTQLLNKYYSEENIKYSELDRYNNQTKHLII